MRLALGDADPTVPYAHAVALHKALTAAGVPNQLFTVPGQVYYRSTRKLVLQGADGVVSGCAGVLPELLADTWMRIKVGFQD